MIHYRRDGQQIELAQCGYSGRIGKYTLDLKIVDCKACLISFNKPSFPAYMEKFVSVNHENGYKNKDHQH